MEWDFSISFGEVSKLNVLPIRIFLIPFHATVQYDIYNYYLSLASVEHCKCLKITVFFPNLLHTTIETNGCFFLFSCLLSDIQLKMQSYIKQ